MTEETERPAWLVLASICDCNKVAASIFDRANVSDDAWSAGFDGVDPMSEVIRSGPDWRQMLVETTMEMAERTGLTISDCCTAVYVGDLSNRNDPQRQAIEEEAAAILYALADRRKSQCLVTDPTAKDRGFFKRSQRLPDHTKKNV